MFKANSPPPLATVLAARRATGSNPLRRPRPRRVGGRPRRNVCLAIRRLLALGLHLVMGQNMSKPADPGYPKISKISKSPKNRFEGIVIG